MLILIEKESVRSPVFWQFHNMQKHVERTIVRLRAEARPASPGATRNGDRPDREFALTTIPAMPRSRAAAIKGESYAS